MEESALGSLRFLIFSLIVFGGLYAVAVTGISQLFFSDQANGSKVSANNQIIGSKLIGQTLEQAEHFLGRSEEISQLSPVSAEQKQLVERRTVAELEKNPAEKRVPDSLVIAPANGVDPGISLVAIRFQAARISKERGLSRQSIRKLIDKHSQESWFSDQLYANVL